MKVYIDGEILDEADAKISVFDHGLLYGDGVFEGIRSYRQPGGGGGDEAPARTSPKRASELSIELRASDAFNFTKVQESVRNGSQPGDGRR